MTMSVDWMLRDSHSGVGQKVVYVALHLVDFPFFILLTMAQGIQLCHFVTRPELPLSPGLCGCRLSAAVGSGNSSLQPLPTLLYPQNIFKIP